MDIDIDFSGIEPRANQIINLALLELFQGNRTLEESRAETIKHYELYKSTFSDSENFWMGKIVDRALEMFDRLISYSATEISYADQER